jgi:predicted metal-dependent enzyme (double-stranded beta helix superfamily)
MHEGRMHTGDAVLGQYVQAVEAIVDRELHAVDTARAIEKANRDLIPHDFQVPRELQVEDSTAPYSRNLVYADPRNRFAVVAMVWPSFRETRVHDHLNWCVVRCLQGTCIETSYAITESRMADGFAEVVTTGARMVPHGAVLGLVPPPDTNLHKMANAAHATAITLHTYGDPGTRARVFDPVSRKVEIVSLRFHNLAH